MMRLLRRFGRLYDGLGFLAWVVPALLGVVAPVLSYAGSALTVLRRRMSMLSDDPEGASDVAVPDPLEWLCSAGWLQGAVRWLLVAGCIVLVLAAAGMVCSRLFAGGVSGVDGDAEERELRDRETDADEPVDVYG